MLLWLLAGGTLNGGFTSIPAVTTHKLLKLQAILKKCQKVEVAEETGRHVSIGRRLYDLWGRVKTATLGDIANGI